MTDKVEFESKLLQAEAGQALAALESAGTRAEELINAWVKSGNAAAVAETADKGKGAARKAARRGLNVLKSRGVALPTKERVASLADKSETEQREAFMLAPDASGTLLLVLTSRPSPASRYRAAFVLLNDEFGLGRVDVGEVSQSGLRDAIAKVLPGANYKPVGVPVEWARHRIAQARAKHKQSNRPEPLGLTRAESLLEPLPKTAPPHPFDDEGLELSAEDAAELGKGSEKLHRLPEFRGWLPTREAIDELLFKVGEAIEPGTTPDQEVLQKALQAEVLSATDRYFSPERREALIRSMRDSAFSILQREGEQNALEVVGTMHCIERCGLITDPPHEVGFLKAFFDKAIAVLLAQGQGSLRIPVRGAPPTAADAPGEGEEAPAPDAETEDAAAPSDG